MKLRITIRRKVALATVLLTVITPLWPGYPGSAPAASAADPVADEKNPKANSNPAYTQLRAIKLSGQQAPVENLVLTRNEAKLTFRNGVFHFLTPVEGKITGAVFTGEGEISLSPVVPLEQKHLSHLTGSSSLTERFSKMVIRFTDSTYDEIKKKSTIQSGPVSGEAQSALDDNRKLLRKGKVYSEPNIAVTFLWFNIDARILIDLTMPSPSGMFQAYFNGKRFGDMLYAIDPLGNRSVAPEEVSLVCFAENSLGIWVSEHFKDHYTNTAVFKEDHNLFEAVHYKIDATPKSKRLDAIVEGKFKSLAQGLRVLPFDLFSRLRVRKVTDSQGRELEFIQEQKEEDADLFVIMADPVQKGQEFTLTFEYGGDDAVLDSGGGNFTLAARSNWYPATYFGDRATYQMTLRSPKGLTMVATGERVSEREEKDYGVTEWKSDIPLAVAGFNYGKFKASAVMDEKLKYKIEAYANRELPDSLKSLQQAVERAESAGERVDATLGSLNTVALLDKARAEAQGAMQLYTALFGPLPYGRIAMTQQPFINFGQAWPMLVYMPLMAYLDSTHRHQLGLTDAANFVRYVAAHEVAHQWWGHIIGWHSYRDQWMSEGFSEFSASLFAQVAYKNDKFIDFWKDQRQQILTKNIKGRKPHEVGGVYMGYRLDTPQTGYVTRAMIYPKGAFILHMIRMMMWDGKAGDQRFSAMMQDFIKTYHNQNVTTQDFWSMVEKHMTPEMDLDGNGKLNWFFNQWVYGTSIPDYKLDYRLEPADGGKTRLVGRITQSNVDDKFKMRVPIYIDYDGSPRRLGTVAMFGNSTSEELKVDLPKKPKKVTLCSFEDVLCTTDAR